MATALNKTAFEILDAEKAHAKHVFTFAGPQTEQFIAGRGSFVFEGATPEKLEVAIQPRAKTGGEILAEHAAGATVTTAGDERLEFAGQLVIPSQREGRIRTARGRVPKALLPAELLKARGKRGRTRGYRAGRFIFERVKGQREGKLRHVLAPSVKLEPRFDFYRIARETAQRVFPQKARDAFAKIRLGK